MGKGRILIMDDEDMVRAVAGKMLQFLGYEVVQAREGGEALGLFRAARDVGTPFDAVILDLNVPGGMDGTATLAELLRLDPDAKCIISSGYGDRAPKGPAPAGHLAVISKPYELKTLGEVLEGVLAGQGRGAEG